MISDTHCLNGVAKVNVFSICAKFFAKTFRLGLILLFLSTFERSLHGTAEKD